MLFLQAGVYQAPVYAPDQQVDTTTRANQSIVGQVSAFVSRAWLGLGAQALLNLFIVAAIYLAAVFVINRFWIATAVVGSAATALAVADHCKVALRNEPVLPSDLSFVASGNTDSLLSFLSDDDLALVGTAVTGILWFAGICVVLQFLDRRNGLIPVRWRPRTIRRAPWRSAALIATRLAAMALTVGFVTSMAWTFNTNGTWARTMALNLGDSPRYWNSLEDAQANGTAAGFMRLAHAKTMAKPADYSKETMEELAKRYRKAANDINVTRAANLTDSTVIMVLSESFSDPTRVPGIAFGLDPMPNVRAIKEGTTSGIMLSSGYGGGTANVEYQTLTGLALANFDTSLQTPYQQLVPHQKTPFAFNQMWEQAHGKDGSAAFHPYYKNMYLRDVDYKKFGFKSFHTLDSTPAVTHQDHAGNNPYVSDSAAYQEVLDQLGATDHPQFIQLVTMQNHLGYDDWYPDNPFKTVDYSQVGDGEHIPIETYAEGVRLTDQATADFLNALNGLDKPVTVVFYGDHLPGIYATAAADENNTLALHETDWFIWSNAATAAADGTAAGNGGEEGTAEAPSAGDGSDDAASAGGYTSSNFFMAQTAQHLDAKVSPYLALLTELHAEVPAMSRVVADTGGFGTGTATLLDADGNPINERQLSSRAKQLLADYRLVQYDMTVGKDYLTQFGFTDLPR
ncbi:LTA synthase family protein [Bifidobacterium pullorum subsp. saeculare]|uniref:LTA synthase family protein n=2 Tax=Bifidobacterium pullorum TaxID=78448 RepID=A0A938WVU6_9BIFI|nr:LTA synthase family protein [Bifidobacterium pullorum subsp. saeculare]